MISIAYKFLLLPWPISIVGGAFKPKGGEKIHLFCISSLQWLELVFFLKEGNLKVNLTPYIFYIVILVVSTIFLYHISYMVGDLFCFFSP